MILGGVHRIRIACEVSIAPGQPSHRFWTPTAAVD
jgi:hypothetical protein